jgi:hypothetical protein
MGASSISLAQRGLRNDRHLDRTELRQISRRISHKRQEIRLDRMHRNWAELRRDRSDLAQLLAERNRVRTDLRHDRRLSRR